MVKGTNVHEPGEARWRKETLGRLYGQLGKAIYSFFINRGCSKEEARDLRQEVFLRAFKGFDGFRGDSRQETWIFGIAKIVWLHRIRDGNRQKRKGYEISLGSDGRNDRPPRIGGQLASDDSPFETAARAEQVQLVRDALERLPPAMRECTLLRMDQEMHYREIAQVLQLTESQVKTNLSRARSKLKDLFQDHRPEVGLPEGVP